MQQTYDWESDIAPYLDSITKVEGGYTPAKRGYITINGGTKLFVKIATDDNTKKWLNKEIKVYTLLNKAGYKYIPKLLSVSDDHSAMAIEFLEGASFERDWDLDKLKAVVEAQEALKEHINLFRNEPQFKSNDIVNTESKWPEILKQDNIQTINAKIKKLGGKSSFTTHQLEELSKLNSGWSLKEDTLIHEDIRADNFGYDQTTKAGKLIDWNWLCIGDESLDTTPLFIDICKSGFNPYIHYPEKLDRAMIAYVLSFWLESVLNGDEDSSEREWNMRSHQVENIDECVKLLA